jgi:hypothetical protein
MQSYEEWLNDITSGHYHQYYNERYTGRQKLNLLVIAYLGSVKLKMLPLPCSDSTQILPPRFSTI